MSVLLYFHSNSVFALHVAWLKLSAVPCIIYFCYQFLCWGFKRAEPIPNRKPGKHGRSQIGRGEYSHFSLKTTSVQLSWSLEHTERRSFSIREEVVWLHGDRWGKVCLLCFEINSAAFHWNGKTKKRVFTDTSVESSLSRSNKTLQPWWEWFLFSDWCVRLAEIWCHRWVQVIVTSRGQGIDASCCLFSGFSQFSDVPVPVLLHVIPGHRFRLPSAPLPRHQWSNASEGKMTLQSLHSLLFPVVFNL